MDFESEKSIKLLECIAACNEQFIALSQWLNSLSNVKNVCRGFDCRAYETGTLLEAYVEAELDEGKVTCWWLDVSWDEEGWQIQASVLVTDDQGQRVLKNFPEKKPQTLEGLVVQMKAVTSELVTYARSMDRSPAWFEVTCQETDR
jgi:hypothetical protein